MFNRTRLLIFLAALSLSAGCQLLERNPATVQLTTQYAVAKYIETKNSPAARYESAQRIVVIAGQLKVLAGGEGATLLALRAKVTSLLAETNLSPADRVLANGLANVLFSEFESRMRQGILDPSQQVAVNLVLDWIVQVALTVPQATG